MEVLITKKSSDGANAVIAGIKANDKFVANNGGTLSVTVSVGFAGKTVSKKIDNIKIVAIGYSHVIVLTQDNNVYGIGNNFKGQLGMGEQINFSEWIFLGKTAIDICAGYVHSAIVGLDNIVYVTGQNTRQQLQLPVATKEVKVWTALPDVKAISVKTEAFKTEIIAHVA